MFVQSDLCKDLTDSHGPNPTGFWPILLCRRTLWQSCLCQITRNEMTERTFCPIATSRSNLQFSSVAHTALFCCLKM